MLTDTLKKIMQALVEASVDTGVADATSAVNHLDDSAKNWPVNAFTDLIIEITAGTGAGDVRKIASNTATSIVPTVNFTVAPDATSQYRIGFFGKMTADIGSWGGTALTGRDVTGDLANITKLIPIAKAQIFNAALPAAEANWLGADITPTNSPSFLRIYVAVAVAGVLRVARTVGGVTVVENLNHGVNLTANDGYIFDIEWRAGDSINFRYSATGANILVFRADEIGGAL